MRWSRYVRTSGSDFTGLWEELATEPLLMVVGGGFDPRVPVSMERILGSAKARVDAVCLDLGAETADEPMGSIAQENRTTMGELITAAGGTFTLQPFPEVHARRSAGINVSRAFHEAEYLNDYRQVLIDISGLPRSIYFPLVRGLLEICETWAGNLHVIACESQEVDSAIVEEGAENPGALGGFAGPTSDAPWAATVWIPVLGEGMAEQLSSLLEEIEPDEVVPVLPFPSVNPRRGDDLVLEHRDLLFDGLAVEPRNYIYASDSNPFDLYRAISELHDRYQASLRPLGAAKFVLSTHSSKLLSVGVLLAAFEKGLQVMHVSPSRYGLKAGVDPISLKGKGTLTDLWLAGDPYR